MAQNPFSTEEIQRLSDEMNVRLAELATSEAVLVLTTKGPKRGDGDLPVPMPEKEAAIVEKTVTEAGQEPASFWMRFKKAAHEDLCEEDGVLNKQWKKWGDLSNETVLQRLGVILTGLGFSGGALQVIALSCGVIVVHLGVKAYCMEAETAGKEQK